MLRLIVNSPVIRQLMWRFGRKVYTYARGDGQNIPDINGEYWLLEHVLKTFSEPLILFDIGANKGDWTAYALDVAEANKDIQIHAFEPSKATRYMLSERFKENNSIAIQPYALSAKAGEASFYSREDGGGTNSLSPISGINEEIVKLITVDQFLNQAAIKAVSMVKIDTEGFDLLVLKGAVKALSDGVIEVIQFEYNWRWLLNNVCLRDVFDLIYDKPYRFGKLVGNSIEFHDQWHFELDRFFENNYVLIRKDSKLCNLGSTIQFNESNVGVKV